MSNSRSELYAELYESAIKATVEAAEKVPADKRTRQAQNEKAHPLWLLGHLAFSFDTVVNVWALNGEPVAGAEYAKPFSPGMAGGDPIRADASTYPAWDDVLESYKKAGAQCVEGIKTLTDEDLPGGLKGPVPEEYKSFFTNLESTIQTMGTHDAHHRGQMVLLASLD